MLLIWLAAGFLLAIAASSFITPLVIRGAAALSLFDSPDGARRLHAMPVPRLGGVSVFLGASIASALVLSLAGDTLFPGGISGSDARYLAGIFCGAALLFFIGLVDDIRDLSPGAKFVAQLAAAAIAAYGGVRIESLTLGYGVGADVGVLAYPLVFLWIVGVTNAYNFIDGLNGLAGGIAVVACATLVVVAVSLGNVVALVPTLALAGAMLGFLRFNYPQARVFLGDSGSLSVGFLLAVLSLRAVETPGHSVLGIVPMLALFVPLLDTFLAVIRRWLRNVPLTGADARHIHHRLLALGISQERTAVLLWGIAAAMGAFGLLIALTAPFVAASIAMVGLVGLSVMVIYGTNLLSYHEFIVAGEVLISAPSRFRRVISDQIIAQDAHAQIEKARGLEEIDSILSVTARRFGFLQMRVVDPHVTDQKYQSPPDTWAWKLEYPLRAGLRANAAQPYLLAIWCSADTIAKPYGAERAAKILAPALERWLVAGPRDELVVADTTVDPPNLRKRASSSRRTDAGREKRL